MTWDDLLSNGDVQPHTTSQREIEDLRRVIERDLKDAQVTGISDDRRYATAYNGALQIAQMAIATAGYKVRRGNSVHYKSFEAMRTAIPTPQMEDLCDFFDVCRRNRNDIDYDTSDAVSRTEVEEIITKTLEFREVVDNWIATEHPEYRVQR